LVATLAGGIAGDLLRRWFGGSYFHVSGAAMLVGFPMVILFLSMPFPLAWIFVALTVFCLFFDTGPTNTILANVTHHAIRASAFAINIFVIHILGDAISPPLLGIVAHRYKDSGLGPIWGLGPFKGTALGFVVVSLMMLVGGVLWIWGARYLERDTRRAPG